MVVKNLPEYLLRVHLQTRRQLGKRKDVKCEGAKMKKNNNTNLTLKPTPNSNYYPILSYPSP